MAALSFPKFPHTSADIVWTLFAGGALHFLGGFQKSKMASKSTVTFDIIELDTGAFHWGLPAFFSSLKFNSVYNKRHSSGLENAFSIKGLASLCGLRIKFGMVLYFTLGDFAMSSGVMYSARPCTGARLALTPVRDLLQSSSDTEQSILLFGALESSSLFIFLLPDSFFCPLPSLFLPGGQGATGGYRSPGVRPLWLWLWCIVEREGAGCRPGGSEWAVNGVGG